MKLTEGDQVQADSRSVDRGHLARADELLRLSFAPVARVRYGTTLAVQTEGKRRSVRCPECGRFDDWAPKRVIGKGRNKRVLEELAYSCRGCGMLRPADDAVDYRAVSSQRSGWNPSSRQQFMYLNPDRILSGSAEERIFGRAHLTMRWRLHRLRVQYQRAQRTKWPARAYVTYVMEFDSRHGSGGISGLMRRAVEQWEYPFPWTRRELQRLVDLGRLEWCQRLATAELLHEGR